MIFLPSIEISTKAQVVPFDVGGGLFERERQIP